MSEHTDVKKLLVLHGPNLDAQGIIPFLREHFEVEVTDELEKALDAMRSSPFHAVLAETADFLPLERGIVTQQVAKIMDTLGEGVCVYSPAGELVWANQLAKSFSAEVVEQLSQISIDAFGQFAAQGDSESGRKRRFSIMPSDGRYLEVVCSPIRDGSGKLCQVVAVVIDATSSRRQQKKFNAIDRAGFELVSLEHDALAKSDATERVRLLKERIISCSRDVLDYKHFTILLLDSKTNRLECLISEGGEDAWAKYELFASPEGNGICGYVAATGRSYICPDVSKDNHYIMFLRGAKSSLTVPLRLSDRIIGVLNVESDQLAGFTEEDRQFAEVFANHVALALHMLNLLISERHTAHSQVSGSVSADLAGPINDIITEATEMLEDYIGHDEIRKRVQGVIDRACDARKYIRSLVESPETGVLMSPAGSETDDPILSGKKVLVADDEELIRTTICDVLSCHGCIVDFSCDGTDAVEMVRSSSYDLVISDIKMPGASGYEVFKAAKEASPQTEVILITAFGYDPNHSIIRASKEGLSAVLMKPFKVNKLIRECHQAIGPDLDK